MLRYSVNLSMLFKECPFLQRFQATADAGFAAVEFLWPTGIDLDDLVRAQRSANVAVALFNVDSGDMPAGERGFASWPDRVVWWRQRLTEALALADRLRCTRLNVQVGNESPEFGRTRQTGCLLENLSWAAPRAREAGVTLMLEALNRFEHPRYLHYLTSQVVEVLDLLAEPNVKMQYDVYHMQRMEGNILPSVRTHIRRLGHVQIADAPDRHQPGTGELNYQYILAQLDALGYDGYVGLEYNPLGSSAESFDWLTWEARQNR